MEPPEDSQERRRTGSVDQGPFDGDDPGGSRSRLTDPDGSTDGEPDSWQVRFDERYDWLDASRRERRRERERRWEQLQLAT